MLKKSEARNHVRTSMSRRARTWGVLLIALLPMSAGLMIGAAPADAALTVNVINTGGQGIASRNAPRLGATNGYGAPEGASVVTSCWTWGDAVGPNANRLWWLISYAGRQMYAADRYLSTPNVANQPPSGEPQCGGAPASTEAPQVWVGSPVDGSWSRSEGAATHHWLANASDQGDWAVDLEANAGQPAFLYAAPQNGSDTITARVDQVGPSCRNGGGGSFATIGLYSGSTRVGSVTYAHLQLAVSPGQTLDRWGALIGYVGTYSYDESCWTGPHVHFQLYSSRHYACFNKGYTPGYPVKRTNFLGFSGGSVAGGPRQRCA